MQPHLVAYVELNPVCGQSRIIEANIITSISVLMYASPILTKMGYYIFIGIDLSTGNLADHAAIHMFVVIYIKNRDY